MNVDNFTGWNPDHVVTMCQATADTRVLAEGTLKRVLGGVAGWGWEALYYDLEHGAPMIVASGWSRTETKAAQAVRDMWRHFAPLIAEGSR